MATHTVHEDANKKPYVVVAERDTLSAIAVEFKGEPYRIKNYQQLAAINDIPNPNLIYVGQKIYLSSSGGSGSNKSNSTKATVKHFGLQINTDNTLFAIWSWDKNNTDKYQVKWEYYAGKVWFVGTSSAISVDENDPSASRQSTYSIPKNATKIRFRVKPIAKKKKVDGKETPHWTASWSDIKTHTNDITPPQTPPTPTVEINVKQGDATKSVLTATLDNLDVDAPVIQFQVIKNNKTVFKTGEATIKYGYATFSCDVTTGTYTVRCRSVDGDSKSEWSDYSNEYSTVPTAPKKITKCQGVTDHHNSVYLEWSAVASAESYDIEYATEKRYFDITDQTTVKTGIQETKRIISDLEIGHEYFFRVRAVKGSDKSAWSGIKSIILGEKPAAPTTWSSTTTAVAGDDVTLYWVHNSKDGSKEVKAVLELKYAVPDETDTDVKRLKYVSVQIEIPNDAGEDDEATIRTYPLETSQYPGITNLKWRICTYGITNEAGEWSVFRTIGINACPELKVTLLDNDENTVTKLTSLPLNVKMEAGPDTATPIGYHVTVKANESYDTVDNMGNEKRVATGEEVYSKYFDVNNPEVVVELSADNITLENNIQYTVLCSVTMDSGLTTEKSKNFTVTWDDVTYEPGAEVCIDTDSLVAYIRPYCDENVLEYYKVSKTYPYDIEVTDEGALVTLDNVFCKSLVKRVKTPSGDLVYEGVTDTGDEVYYCTRITETAVEDVTLSVYRRAFDGTFVELATGIDSNVNTYITDPHPALDFARYRIVAKSTTTNTISYYDVPGEPVGEKAAVIQWDEDWIEFDAVTDDPLEQPAWTGSMLKLPWNLDVSDRYSPEVSLVEYIGRSHPVSYYGTQRGETSSWSMVIEKSDAETLYMLRRLATWMGDVYVREPSGSGYWANVTVSFGQKHKEMTIPVTIDITRVEGGA